MRTTLGVGADGAAGPAPWRRGSGGPRWGLVLVGDRRSLRLAVRDAGWLGPPKRVVAGSMGYLDFRVTGGRALLPVALRTLNSSAQVSA